ncbi:sporulation protein YlmC with PRC-barrel domain [Constrictibacter sp. MBR-5]|jgi:sporulation protein YlmC with PRC-barrel domain|uniref:PRC-barrel domain-containing protein n=1 Tax=Constrictibacter sp. MBR-5 TaxID=3156467 RepID=UPI0033971040
MTARTITVSSAIASVLLFAQTGHAANTAADKAASSQATQAGSASQASQPGGTIHGRSAGGQATAGASSQCRQDLTALGQTMQEDGYWLSGYRSYGTTVAAPGATATPSAAGRTMGPWGDVGWETRPHVEMRTLYRAADILAQRGNEEACREVLDATRTTYREYAQQLEGMGVQPQQISDWRQAEIVNAKPVSEMASAVRIEDIIGSDLRNAQDEDLGEVEDVVLDPATGDVKRVIVSRGGFLGMGEDRVAVPWNKLRATPGMNTLVLPVSEQAMEQAPTYDGTMSSEAADTDAYWDKTLDK